MLTVLHDVHLGVNRAAGTTVVTRQGLKDRMRSQFEALLPDTDLLILGDLFDTHDVPEREVWETFQLLATWLRRGHKLWLVAGNHDLSKTSTTFSSFELLCSLLGFASQNVVPVFEPVSTPYGYVIPHLPNQVLFDEALAAVPACAVLFLHVNYDNHFAAESDQSLNISEEQAAACPATKVVIAHEHNKKLAGKVIIPGNQVASSVSDWVHSPAKFYATVSEQGQVDLVQASTASSEYLEQDWRQVDWSALPTTYAFVRLVGDAAAEEATQVVNAVARYRAASSAMVVSSGVRIAQADEAALGVSLESVQAFDVWAALSNNLTPEQITKLRAL